MGYPRSFLGLLLAGFTLVALPLVGALAYSAWNTERLTEQSRNAVYSASQAARASRSLVNRIGSIERLAQQVAVVNDAELAEDYRRVHRSFKQVADELLLLPLEEKQLAALEKTVEQEQALYNDLSVLPWKKGDVQRVGRLTAELAENAQEVLSISYLVADREVLNLRHNAEIVQRQLILLVIFSTAVVLIMALALTRYISRSATR
jgi:two-component system, NtrC family, sensor histidine kinase GlrK